MILGFKKQFVKPILSGIKRHSIREDVHNRWQPGRIIHFATGVRTKDYNQFKMGICQSVQQIEIKYNESLIDTKIIIEGKKITLDQKQKLAWNDGFQNLAAFLLWFNKDFKGKIIQWTNFRY